VVEILPLEEEPELAAAQLRELRRLGQRRGTADIIGQDVVELAAEVAVALVETEA